MYGFVSAMNAVAVAAKFFLLNFKRHEPSSIDHNRLSFPLYLSQTNTKVRHWGL